MGSTFRAVVAGCDRAGYAAGGAFGDGPGQNEHLWGGRRLVQIAA